MAVREAGRRSWGPTERARLIEAARAVLPRFPGVAAAYLYGSALRDDPVGDVDIALIEAAAAPPDLAEYGRLARAIEERFGADLPEPDLRRIGPDLLPFAYDVLRGGTRIYEADRARRIAVETAITREFLDTEWLRESYRRLRRRLGGHAA